MRVSKQRSMKPKVSTGL